jgi:hypothetical protein
MNTEIETLTNEIEQSLPKFEETKIEEAGYTKNVEEWLEFIKEPQVDRVGEYIFDYEIIKNAEVFGLGPVFSYNGKVEACSLIEYDSLNDMKNFLKGKKYLVYYILCQVISGPIGAIETKDLFITFKDTFLPIDRIGKNPKIRYIFRGHILE